MFEGLVRQLLLGYLGRYIKDIHRDQLKITVWNEEVLLENVELILEAFEYLQLPFALKQGRIGKLSIKIPWKKLGRESIIITLEDVYVCVSQRSDQEWSSDAVERRGFAGKRAKLAAAELEKLSRRVSDSPAGNPFMSYITAKILDSIQVSIRNFHVLYYDGQPDIVQGILGLRFSSLTVTKQNPIGPSIGRVRGGQVNKLVEIEALEIYCDNCEGNVDLLTIDSKGVFDIWCDSRLQTDKFGYLLKPVNVCVTLLVNRSGELYDDLPQYSISAELTDVVMTLNEFQLQQILIMLDCLQTSQLRERYGRYRPCSASLLKKPPGWQRLWWHYAQESILSDVRKRLWKTSWRYLGQRMNNRRKYINLYKIKLNFLRKEEPIDESVLMGLEQVEKETDIDDILRYRSVAEGEMQEAFPEVITHNGAHGVNASEKQQSDDRSSSRPQGWLNWLSRGMLGAGGTDDSSQFSGAVSDEVVKDIHEATKFQPQASSPRNVDATEEICTCSMRLNIHKISAALQSIYRHSCQVIAELDILGIVLDCKFQTASTAIIASVDSGRLVYPRKRKEILTMEGACSESDALEIKPSCRAEVEVYQEHDVALSLKVTLQPLEVTYDGDFFHAAGKFFSTSRSFKLQHERVLSSLNGLDDKTRFVAKAEYLLSSRNRVKWDVNITGLSLNFPGPILGSENYSLVFLLGSLCVASKRNIGCLGRSPGEKSSIVNGFRSSDASLNDLQVKDLYEHFEFNLNDFEIRLTKSHPLQVVPVLERSSILINLASCIVPDESTLKQLEVNVTLSVINVHFSPSIYLAVSSAIEYLDIQDLGAHSNASDPVPVFFFAINANFAFVRLHVNLENNGENSMVLILCLQELDLWYSLREFEEWLICMKAFEMIACPSKDGAENHILCSSGDLLARISAHGQKMGVENCDEMNIIDHKTPSEAFFRLHYEAYRSNDCVCHKYTVYWRDAKLHCYPYIYRLLTGFFDKMSSVHKNHSSPTGDGNTYKEMPQFEFERFGFSNFIESGTCGCIPLETYPFVTIYNSGSLGSLESSLYSSIADWRKIFSLRDKKDRAEDSLKGESKRCPSPLKCDRCSDVFSSSRGLGQTSLFMVDVHLFDASVNFHDSSCIFGTIILPESKCLLTMSVDSMDLFSSVEDIKLKSPLWTNYFDGILWGHSLPNLSPVMNMRVRKGNFVSPGSELEISIGIQHVCCILPPEYLTILIGYFSLPDWTSKSGLRSVNQATELVDVHSEFVITYKFEILDSILILPVENDYCRQLKVDIEQLYFSYITECALSNVLQDIPQECAVSLDKVAPKNECFNIFGRNLSLSLLLSKNGGSIFKQDTPRRSITLASPVSADVWIRVPCDSKSSSTSTCIMARVGVCEIFADDSNALRGLKDLLDIIDQFSLLDEESKFFVSDVFQFLHTMRHLKQEKKVIPLESFTNCIEIRCFVSSFRMKLHHVKEGSELEPVIQFDLKFLSSVTLKNNLPTSLDIQFFDIGLYSQLNSVKLARCPDNGGNSSALGIRLAERSKHEFKLYFSLPSLGIWLHSSEWIEVIELFSSYVRKLEDCDQDNFFLKGSNPDTAHVSNMSQFGPTVSPKQDMVFTARSEYIGVKIYFPLCVSDTAFPWLAEAAVQEERSQAEPFSCFKGKYCKYISVAACSKSLEVFVLGRDVKLSCNFENLDGTVAMSSGEIVRSCSLFGVSQLKLETETQMDHSKIMNMDVKILSDHVDMLVSHQALSFWRGIAFDGPETVSSQHRQGNIKVRVGIRDVSLLISDGRRGCSGLLLEALMRNFSVQADLIGNNVESLVSCDLEVNCNNIRKVLWEPFIEPWKLDMKINRKFEINAMLSNSALIEIAIASSAQLNVNLTEALFECIFRTIEMAKDALGLMESDGTPENKGSLIAYDTRNSYGKRYAPYVVQNLTSLPLVYQVFHGLNSDVSNMSAVVVQNSLLPGASVPIYLDDPDTQIFHRRHDPSYSGSSGKWSDGVAHHLMSVRLDGTSVASPPCSMDRIGLTYFDIDFSETSNNGTNIKETSEADLGASFVVPVVFEVSLQRHSKLIRLYSTVIILNSTSMPLELRFDIPFGVSPKILDPIYPGQEFPLPLHLAEAGRMRWRPLGDSYLWSEAHSISKVLSQESKIGFRRSFACYPCHLSNEPFRCCISVQSISVPASFNFNVSPEGNCGQAVHGFGRSRERVIHQVTLSTPLVVRNCLPEPVSLTIKSGGINQAALLAEGETPFHHIDPSHDLAFEFKMHGFRPSGLKFPRAESFCTLAKFSGGKFSQIETVCFDSELCGGSIYLSFEKFMDVTCGAREVFIFVPFLLYNCTGTPLIVTHCTDEARSCIIPSCYNLIEQHFPQSCKEGLIIVSSELDKAPNVDGPGSPSLLERNILTRRNPSSDLERYLHKPMLSSTLDRNSNKQQEAYLSADQEDSSARGRKRSLSAKSLREACFLGDKAGKVKACIYSPCPVSNASDIMIRIQRALPGSNDVNTPNSLWSARFPLVPPSGSTSVVVPQSSPSGALLLSVTCCVLGGAFVGRTQAITFQPRYVICNSCSRDFLYKQKGTDLVSHLAVGQHSQLHWTDNTRELLVSIRFNEPGWQWSGSFLPYHLGDTQLKLWNYVTGAVNTVRVEVQNADVLSGDEQIVGSLRGNVGTNLILLSDDDTGYMPYRIDNFSKERLRVYQQKCETFDTIVHPYTSCPYAWDEPCYPHRLMIEVPGDRVIGSYTLDMIKQPVPVHLRSTSEKPERTLLLSIYAEGATKVLSIVDSGYHNMKDIKEQPSPKFLEKGRQKLQKDKIASYTEKFSLVLPSIGVSLVNSQPQELVYACVSNVVFDLNQSVDQQKLSFQISSLQIDNPLRNSSYPVILSFNHEHRSSPSDLGIKDNNKKSSGEIVRQVTNNPHDTVLFICLAKWRKKDVSLISFEHINLRIADFCLELELETILSLLEFVKAVLPNSQSRLLPFSDPTLHPLVYDVGSVNETGSEDCPPHAKSIPVFNKNQRSVVSLPSFVPIGAPWQQIHLLARRHRKLYVETFELAPVKFTLSFSSTPWMLRNSVLASGDSLIHRGLMALADVEGARINLKQLTIAHYMASWESFQEILMEHYTRQILHEIYKVFGSAGVIGNPMGFARNVALGIKDFLSAPARSVSKSPTRLIQGMAQGTTSLLSSTVYALSDAATQFSKAAHKGIVAFTFNDHDVARMEKQQKGEGSHSKGVIGEVFEGLTGLLQSPIRGAEKHGLPGVVSGIALGVTGLVARPTASLLEVTGKTAQSIRNRSRLHNTRSQKHRVRLPRPLSRELPLRPYSWEEAVGTAVLMEAGDGPKFKGEQLVMCKALKQGGNFVVVTARFTLVVSCPSLADFRKPGFQGVPLDLEWKIETEIDLESVIHAEASNGVVHIVGSSTDGVLSWRQTQQKKGSHNTKRSYVHNSALPLLHTNLEMPSEEEAEEFLRVLLSTIEAGKSRGWNSRHVLHQSNIG